MTRFRRRCLQLLRLPALAVLLLAVLVNPVLAAVGDLHESSHGSTEHAQATGTHNHDDAGTQEQGIDLLHALMHAAHCCGHLTAILSTAYFSQAPSFSSAIPVAAVAAPHSAPRTDPFRPPIAI
jgi:hypothetical protein